MDNTITIQIADKDYLIKKSNRSLMMFEEMTKKSAFQIDDSITDLLTIFYCILKANNKEFEYTRDEFIDLLDEHQEAIEVFSDYLEKEAAELEANEEANNKKKQAKPQPK